MTHQFKVFNPDTDEAKELLVESVYNRERDLYTHQQNLARYTEILSDPDFVGREFPDGSTYRQKLEKEVLTTEGAIKECQRLIEVSESKLPNQAKVSEIVDKIKGREKVLQPSK